MALADPQKITIAGTLHTLPKISTGPNSATYGSPDGDVKITVSHNYGRRNRHLVRVDFGKIAPDPFSGANQRYSMSTYTVVDAPPAGFSTAELADVVGGLTAFLAVAGVPARVIGGES